MSKLEDDLKSIKKFYETVIVLPDLATFRKTPPVDIYAIVERCSGDEIWEHLSQIVKLLLASENEVASVVVADLIPSLIWAHIRGIVEKKASLRNNCEKILLMIFGEKRTRDNVEKFNETAVKEAMFATEDARKHWGITNDDAWRQEPKTTRFSTLTTALNSELTNVDMGVKGACSAAHLLKYIPLSQCLAVYAHLVDLVCFHSRSVTRHCFLALFRLIHRVCRVGYPPHLFAVAKLNAEDSQFIMNPAHVRVVLSNYLVERFCFLLLRAVFCGHVEEALSCAKDLHVVTLRQNLFVALTGVLSLIRLISKFLDEQTIKRRDFYMLNPKDIYLV